MPDGIIAGYLENTSEKRLLTLKLKTQRTVEVDCICVSGMFRVRMRGNTPLQMASLCHEIHRQLRDSMRNSVNFENIHQSC